MFSQRLLHPWGERSWRWDPEEGSGARPPCLGQSCLSPTICWDLVSYSTPQRPDFPVCAARVMAAVLQVVLRRVGLPGLLWGWSILRRSRCL